MATINITKDNFADTIKNNQTVVFDFWAPWCGPCRFFGPIFEAASESHPEITFGKINTEEQPELSSALNIGSIPTLMVFKEEIGIFSQPGALPEEALTSLLDQVKKLDMDEVRKEMAKQDPA